LLMGVSKAIMENVIFCHQEESSWPLSDPASLKKKFDDIFESSRYSKALETIRKTKIEYNNKSKDMKVELAGLDANKQNADLIGADIDKIKADIARYVFRKSPCAQMNIKEPHALILRSIKVSWPRE
jgi:DNA repair protein RAD50